MKQPHRLVSQNRRDLGEVALAGHRNSPFVTCFPAHADANAQQPDRTAFEARPRTRQSPVAERRLMLINKPASHIWD